MSSLIGFKNIDNSSPPNLYSTTFPSSSNALLYQQPSGTNYYNQGSQWHESIDDFPKQSTAINMDGIDCEPTPESRGSKKSSRLWDICCGSWCECFLECLDCLLDCCTLFKSCED